MLVVRIWKPFRRSIWTLPIAVFFLNLSSPEAFAIDSHSDDSGKSGSVIRRQDRDVLVKRLTDVVNKSTVRRTDSGSPKVFRLVSPDDPAVKEASKKGIPVSVSLVALKAENGLTPQQLFDLVQKLKTEAGTDNIAQNAKELARRLMAPPSKIREIYTRDGRFDFQSLARDLTLDEAAMSDRKEAFRRAIEDDPVAPIPSDQPSPSPSVPPSPDPTFTPFPDDGTTFDPTKDGLGDLVDQDDLILDDDEEDKNKNDKNLAKNEKNGKNGKNGGAGKGAGTPPTPPQPPTFPPISANMGGGGKEPQPLPMPSPPEIPPMPPFQMPPPPPESGMDPNLLIALLGRNNKTGEAPPNAGMADILKGFADMNQATIAAILQLGSQLLASSAARNKLTASPPPRTANVSGQGSLAARIQNFSGPRVSTAVTPRTGTGTRNPTGTIAQSMTQQSPRSGTIPGYGAKGRSVVKPGSR